MTGRAQEPDIELRNVSLSYGSRCILQNINLSIFPGQSLAIVGRSGQGKTSLLKLMSGLLDPTQGAVFWQGKNLNDLSHDEKRIKLSKMGMLFQRTALFDSLSAFNNVAFPLLETTPMPQESIETCVNEYLASVGLSGAQDLLPDQMSGGMQKRLGIARALVLEPRIVFYDDPTAGLDPVTSRTIANLIGNLQKKFQSTNVAVTNDMNRAYQLGERILFIFEGSLFETGNKIQTLQCSDLRVQQFVRGNPHGPLTAERMHD